MWGEGDAVGGGEGGMSYRLELVGVKVYMFLGFGVVERVWEYMCSVQWKSSIGIVLR